MGASVSVAVGLKHAGVIAAALVAAVAVLAPHPRTRAVAMGGALILTPVLLMVEIWNTPQFRPVRHRPGLALAVTAVAVVALVGFAVLIERRPSLLAFAAFAVLPFRIPIESGGQTANLLVPLYFVIAAGCLARILSHLRDGEDEGPSDYRPGLLEWLLMAAVVVYAVQSLYSEDFSKALEQVVFFYVPFALLFGLLSRLSWTPQLAMRCFGVLVVLALVFCVFGFVEYETRTLLLNPRVIASNQFQSYFRVNSLFFDPNIYGRFLAVVMLAVAALLLWTRDRREVWVLGGILAVLWAGLLTTLSQSSLVALLVGLAVLGALRFGVRAAAAVTGALLVAGLVVVLVAPGVTHVHLRGGKSLNSVTSGRFNRVKGGMNLFADRPLQGYGPGSFVKVFRRERSASVEHAVPASHTTPVTVAAEQGVVGLLLYLALLAAALWRLLPLARGCVIRAAIASVFIALVAHTMLYAAFLEDPLTWTALGMGTAFWLRRVRMGAAADTTGTPAPAAGEPASSPA